MWQVSAATQPSAKFRLYMRITQSAWLASAGALGLWAVWHAATVTVVSSVSVRVHTASNPLKPSSLWKELPPVVVYYAWVVDQAVAAARSVVLDRVVEEDQIPLEG